jgi:hypothetical protein
MFNMFDNLCLDGASALEAGRVSAAHVRVCTIAACLLPPIPALRPSWCRAPDTFVPVEIAILYLMVLSHPEPVHVLLLDGTLETQGGSAAHLCYFPSAG